MLVKLLKKILSFFDYFNQKKILFLFRKLFKKKINIIFDVGAHHGETIDFYLNNFDVNKIYSFEPSKRNYSDLIKHTNSKKNLQNEKIKIYNFGLGEKKETMLLNQAKESSSSTLNEVNFDSTYFKKKISIFLPFMEKKNFFSKEKVEIETLEDFIKKEKIECIDILKIDTEGYELNVLKGLNQTINKIKYIHFEHHYHDMLIKNYKYSEINNLLIKNNFVKIFKMKMCFRKAFEYVYENKYS